MAHPIGAHGRRILDAIAAGRRFRRSGNGWSAGSLHAPDSLIAELDRRGLAMVRRATLALGRSGESRAAHAGPRLLVERSLPQDGEPRPGERAKPRARSVTVNLAESPLGWLKARGLVSDRQFEAGERLRGDWTVAGLGPRVTMRWDAGARSTGDGLDPTLAQVSAKRRMDAAMDAVGAGLKDILWRIVCAGEGMETAERALGWSARSGRVVLGIALDRLADFYGLK